MEYGTFLLSQVPHWKPITGQKIYHPRNAQQSQLWQLLNAHFAGFKSCYGRNFARDYGFYREVVPYIVKNYLECGDMHEGFARVRLPGL